MNMGVPPLSESKQICKSLLSFFLENIFLKDMRYILN